MSNLDDAAVYEELDKGNMRQRIGELPQQCIGAWEMAQRMTLPPAYQQVRQVIVLGMGGSAIGGALLARLVADTCPLPIHSVNGYHLPAHVGPDSLVVASSHSGDTEETLAALALAEKRGCRLVAITTGGKLATLARKREIPLLSFAHHGPPRAALGYSFTLLLGLLSRLGYLPDYRTDLESAVATMRYEGTKLVETVPETNNPAKRLARRLHGRLPVVYGAGFLSAVARRWKGQFNENSKNWAVWEELPELNHNAVVGYRLPPDVRKQATVLLLRSSLDHHRIRARWEATGELLAEEGITAEEIWARGESRLAQMFSLIHLGDYVSLYLALLNGVDPTPVEAITRLKQGLAAKA